MKKYPPIIAGIILGLLFVVFSLMFLLKLGPTPPPPAEGSPAALFMGALYPTGYLTFVKVLELLGGILVAIPRTRNLGLLVLGPIIVNILAFHVFIGGGKDMLNPVMVIVTVLPLYLLWDARKKFLGLLN
jgi:putative oxidoreductase